MIRKIFEALTATEKKVLLASAGVFVAATAALVTFYVQTSTAAVPSFGGSYAEGMVGQPTFINPLLAADDANESLIHLIYSNVSDLADKIEPDRERGARAWRVRLKEGVLWQDGRKLTSDDIIFTIKKIQEGGAQSPQFVDWDTVAVSRLSELELQFSLPSPYAFFPDTLRRLYVVPKHLFADIPFANIRLSDFNLKPVGSGPYQTASVNRRRDGFIESYILEGNPKYFGTHPFISKIIFSFYANSDDLIAAFNNGRIDGWITYDPALTRQIQRTYSAVAIRSAGYYGVFFNSSRNGALKDASVRRALVELVDADRISREVFGDLAVPSYGPVPPGGANTIAAENPFSKNKASELLASAGWKLNESGRREKQVAKNQTAPLELTVTVPQVPFLLQTATEIKKEWEEAGISVKLEVAGPDEAVDGKIKNRDYEALLFGNVLSSSSDLYPFWHSSQRFYPGLNLSVYSNKSTDSMIDDSRQSLDAQVRQKNFEDAQRSILADAPAVFLYSPSYTYALNKKVRGVQIPFLSDAADRFSQIQNWYVKTKRIIKQP